MNDKWRSDNPPYYLSAYALACKRGFEGTIDDWLLSLTAYGLAVMKGFKGTQEEWLAYIKGKSAYQYAVEAGYKGTEKAFGDRLNQQGKTAYEYAIEGGYVGTIEDFRKKLAAEYLLKTGGAMSGDIAMGGHKVTGLGTPTDASDAVPKSYAVHMTGRTASLPVSGWSDLSQTVSVEGITAENTLIVSPAPDSITACSEAGMYCAAQGAGTLTFVCADMPEGDVVYNILILE